MTNVRFNSDVQGGQPKIQHHLRHLRTQRGLTLKQISDGTGLSISTLHAIEKQEREPTLSAFTGCRSQTRVVAVESQSLVIRGILSGNVLIINTDPEFPLRSDFASTRC